MKKKLLIFVIPLCIFLVVGVVFTILFFTNNIYTNVKTFLSPNKEYKIVIKSNGTRWSFGEENIKIYAYKNSLKGFFEKNIYETPISNDGKILNDTNFKIDWESNIAYLTLSGEEQIDEVLEIKFNDIIIINQKNLN
mgnify:CR=1 FL=1